MQRNYADTLPLTLLFRISRRGPSYLRNQQRRAFAKSTQRVIFATKPPSSRLCTVKSAAILPAAEQTVEEQDENSHAEASSSQASHPVVCSQYLLSKFQEEDHGRDKVNHSTGEPEVPAVNEDTSATPFTSCQREASHQASSSDPSGWKPCIPWLWWRH